MKRLLLFLPALLLFAIPALAVTAPEITLTKVTPEIPAIHAVVNGTTIEIRGPAEELILYDPQGQPFLKMTGAAVIERTSDGWREVRKENFFYLHDGHVGRAVLERKQLPYPWRIDGTYGGKLFVMEGTIVPAGTYGKGAADDVSGATAALFLISGVTAGALVLWLIVRSRRKTV